MKVAINGMGRIGRLLFRRLMKHPAIKVAAVNDVMNKENLVYLIKYDSVYGHVDFAMELNENIIADGQEIKIFNEPHPQHLPWKELGIDVVLECTGRFTSKELASHHLKAGAKKVLLSTTGSDDIPLLIYGHNQHSLKSETTIISPGGCMTNCSTHIIYLMNSIGIESAQLNFIHSYTSRQELVDAPHKDFRRGRAAAASIIPVAIDLAQSLERLFPALKNKIATTSTRVPVANGALGDFTFQLQQKISVEKINILFKKAAEREYKGIIEYTEEPIVSLDIKCNPHSAIVNGPFTSVVEKQVKLFIFFDNEYGYTSRMINWLENI